MKNIIKLWICRHTPNQFLSRLLPALMPLILIGCILRNETASPSGPSSPAQNFINSPTAELWRNIELAATAEGNQAVEEASLFVVRYHKQRLLRDFPNSHSLLDDHH